jgi:hypothetical protein
MNDNNFNQTQVDQEEYTASSTEGGYEYSSGDPASSLFVPVLTVTLLLFTYLGYRAYAKRRDSMAFDSVSTACQDINDAFELSDMDSLHDRNDRKLTRKFKKRLKAKNKNLYMPPPAESDEDGMYVREESSNLV